jgi:hypothetical protein
MGGDASKSVIPVHLMVAENTWHLTKGSDGMNSR